MTIMVKMRLLYASLNTGVMCVILEALNKLSLQILWPVKISIRKEVGNIISTIIFSCVTLWNIALKDDNSIQLLTFLVVVDCHLRASSLG